MMKSPKLKKSGLLNAVRASAIALVLLLGVLAAPAAAFAQDDAGAVAAVSEEAPSAVASTQPDPAPAAIPVAAESTPASAAAPAAPAVVAAPSATKTSLDKLSSEVLNVLIPIFVLLAGAIGTAALNWIRKRLKLDVSDKQIYQWSMVAEMAANRAGEWARNKAKDLTEGKTIPGPDILEVGANWGLEYGKAHGLTDIGREKLEGLIEAHLNVKRKPAES